MRFSLKICLCLLCCGLVPGVLPAAESTPAQWEIDTDHSSVGFRIRHIAGYVPGVFSRFTGQVEYDPDRPEKSQFYLLIDSSSVHTGVPARDDHLRSPDFLDVERSPRMIFSSRNVIREDGDTLVVIGDLTIRDVTAEVRVPLQVLGVTAHPLTDEFPGVRVLGLHAKFSINRLDFHVGTDKWTQMGVMGETVELTVDMELLQR
jgi:polyisoprenoid-binding protein YceI